MTQLLAAGFKYTTDQFFSRPVDDEWGGDDRLCQSTAMHWLRKDRGPTDVYRSLPGPQEVEFVYASEHIEALAQRDLARQQASTLQALARRLASTNPHKNGWETSYRAMQEQARSTLVAISRAT